jgi:hypothetical protein
MHTQFCPNRKFCSLNTVSRFLNDYKRKQRQLRYVAELSVLGTDAEPDTDPELEVAITSLPMRVGAILRFFFSPPSSLSLSL